MQGRKGEACNLYKHGESKTKLHKKWRSMHDRCERPNNDHYQYYGGRGIKVCDEWKEYMPFAKWARENGYADGLTLDRIDNDGNYEPSNCRWITLEEQASNKSTNRILEYKGEKYTLIQLAKKIGMKRSTLGNRLLNGWSVEDAVERPLRKSTRVYKCKES